MKTAAGIVCAAIGLLFTVVCVSVMSKANDSESWPTVEGTVLESKVVKKEEKNDDGETTIMYTADVAYRYDFGGRSYKSAKVSHVKSSSSSSAEAETTAARYAPGRRVRVFVNPSDPSDAVLETSAGGGPVLGIVFGVIFMLVGVGVIVAGRRPAPVPERRFMPSRRLPLRA